MPGARVGASFPSPHTPPLCVPSCHPCPAIVLHAAHTCMPVRVFPAPEPQATALHATLGHALPWCWCPLRFFTICVCAHARVQAIDPAALATCMTLNFVHESTKMG